MCAKVFFVLHVFYYVGKVWTSGVRLEAGHSLIVTFQRAPLNSSILMGKNEVMPTCNFSKFLEKIYLIHNFASGKMSEDYCCLHLLCMEKKCNQKIHQKCQYSSILWPIINNDINIIISNNTKLNLIR